MKPVLSALLSGVLLYLSQGLDDMWFLAGFALIPILWLAYANVPVWQLILASMSAWLTAARFGAGNALRLSCVLDGAGISVWIGGAQRQLWLAGVQPNVSAGADPVCVLAGHVQHYFLDLPLRQRSCDGAAHVTAVRPPACTWP